MSFERLTYAGPPIDDAALLAELPSALATLLRAENGFLAFEGGLHVRGACRAPAWHSLRAAWRGPESVTARYPWAIRPTDIPFGQDALGDQFLLRDAIVHRLEGETGTVESLGVSLTEFLERCRRDPVAYLNLQPLVAYQRTGGRLAPGQLLSVYPPFCTAHEGARSYRAIAAADRLGALAAMAAQLRDLPSGTVVQFKIAD